MTRYDYISKLISLLEDLPPKEKEKLIEYYTDYFKDGNENKQTDEEIIAQLGPPEYVALRYKADYVPDEAPVKTVTKSSKSRKSLVPYILTGVICLLCGVFVSAMVVGNKAYKNEVVTEVTHDTSVQYDYKAKTDEAREESMGYIDLEGIVQEAINESSSVLEYLADEWGYDNTEWGNDWSDSWSDNGKNSSLLNKASSEAKGFDIDSTELVQKRIVLSDIDSLDIGLFNDDIIVTREGIEFYITYFVRFGGIEYDISEENGIFKLLANDDYRYLYERANADPSMASRLEDQVTYINIPEGYDMKDLTLSTIRGDINVKGVYAEYIDCSTISGESVVENTTVNDITLSSISGNILLDTINSSEITTSTISGDAGINKIITNSVDMSTVSGDLNMSNIDFDWAECSGISGNMHFSLPSAGIYYNIDSLKAKVAVNGERYSVSKEAVARLNKNSGDNAKQMDITTISGYIDIEMK